MIIKYKPIVVVFFIMLVITFKSCKKDEDDKLIFQRTPYSGSQLKINGYYYNEDSDRYSIYFLYQNGVILYGQSPKVSEILKYEERYRNGNYAAQTKDVKIYWGLFQINSNIIQYEKWGASNGVLSAFRYSGEILNDTTYKITKYIRVNGKDASSLIETYHFKAFNPKPDSTNSFVN